MIKKMLITGASGMLGTALKNSLPAPSSAYIPTSKELDLTDRKKVARYISEFEYSDSNGSQSKLDYVYHLAAHVGGVKANSESLVDFHSLNAQMGINLLDACAYFCVPKVVSVLSTCVYPDTPYVSLPLTEDQLHLGPPHSSNFGYAYAKRMLDVHSRAIREQHGLDYVTVIPNNLFGQNDNFHLEHSHVIPALMRKYWEAHLNGDSEVEVWGDGTSLREFTYAEDAAKIMTLVAEEYDDAMPINIGNTDEYAISQVADMISHFMGFSGKTVYNTDMPSGQHRKPSSNARLLQHTSWTKDDYTPFDKALYKTCEWFKARYPHVRGVEQS